MRVADYIAQLLADNEVSQCFMVTGGGAMHLNDAFKRQESIDIIFCHHEQACSMAAESYARLSGRPALVNVTSGPGGINALNGVFGAFVDSLPMIIVSGQVKRETLVSTYDLPLRQLGDQEADIISIAKPICKSVIQLRDPEQTRFVIEKALWLSKNGRPGPVWIDVPIDVQALLINNFPQNSFDPLVDGEGALPKQEQGTLTGSSLVGALTKTLEKLSESERPVILVGAGVRISRSHEIFLKLIDKLGIPVTTGWNAHDALWNAHPLFVGRPGSIGDRAGNFAVQNSDFLLVLGSRLNIRQIGYSFESFARNAFIAMIDADNSELNKPTLSVDLPIHADLNEALQLLMLVPFVKHDKHGEYLRWCKDKSKKFPVVISDYSSRNSPINPYVFAEKLFQQLDEGDTIVTGDGTACVVTFQAANLKPGQRLYTNSGCASMGYDLPAAIGAALANHGKRVICLAGDGSIMMNLQELQTIVGNQLPIKLFILSNNGYSSIRQSQRNYFPDNIVGCGPDSGLSFPNFTKLGSAFGIASQSCKQHDLLSAAIKATITNDGPQILEVFLDPEQPFAPKLASRQLPDGGMVSGALEDLAPFLSREELKDNMIIPLEGN